MTASAGSTASGDGATDADGAASDAATDAAALGVAGAGVFVVNDGAGDAEAPHAPTRMLVAIARVRTRLSFTGVLLLEWQSARCGRPPRGRVPSTDGFACDH